MDTSDWRAQLQPQVRQSVVKKIINTVKLWHAFNDEDELELEKVAQSYERKTYAGATSQSDYFQIIRSKMVSMERQTKEEVYQKIQVLKERHLQVVNEIYLRFCKRIQQVEFQLCPYLKSHNFFMLEKGKSLLERLEKGKKHLERVIAFLHVSKGEISPSSKKKLAACEKVIMKCEDGMQKGQGNPIFTSLA